MLMGCRERFTYGIVYTILFQLCHFMKILPIMEIKDKRFGVIKYFVVFARVNFNWAAKLPIVYWRIMMFLSLRLR